MHQQIALETRRDASAMKSLSFLGVLFLPATAVAVGLLTPESLVCMLTMVLENMLGPFISISPDNKNFSVVDDYWIFWAICCPLTLIVLIVWLAWQNRHDLPWCMTKWKQGQRLTEPGQRIIEENIPAPTGESPLMSLKHRPDSPNLIYAGSHHSEGDYIENNHTEGINLLRLRTSTLYRTIFEGPLSQRRAARQKIAPWQAFMSASETPDLGSLGQKERRDSIYV